MLKECLGEWFAQFRWCF